MKKVLSFLILLWNVGAIHADQIVFVTGEFPPYASESLPGHGMVTEIVTAATEALDWKSSVEFLPWKRCEFRLVNGTAFAAFPYFKTPEREKQFLFSDTLGVSKVVFFYNKKTLAQPPTWSTLKDLKPYTIGGIIGTYYEKSFRDAGIELDLATTEAQAIEKLLKNRVQLLCIDQTVGLEELRRVQGSDFGILDKPLNVAEFALMVSKTYPHAPDLLKAFNKGLQTIRDKGTYQRILKKYGL